MTSRVLPLCASPVGLKHCYAYPGANARQLRELLRSKGGVATILVPFPLETRLVLRSCYLSSLRLFSYPFPRMLVTE
jgi:hypothetical protein